MTAPESIRLLLTSGDGPAECRLAVSLCLARIREEALAVGLSCDAVLADGCERGHPSSVVVTLAGSGAGVFASRWIGTIQWTCKSPFRPHHKRSNWFVGVFLLPGIPTLETAIDPADLRFETFRAGGAGGQHQNTTDSAVRVAHLPSGVTALSRDERSQHRNKKKALGRLIDKLALAGEAAAFRSGSDQAALHKSLERGNPLRCFRGEGFIEER